MTIRLNEPLRERLKAEVDKLVCLPQLDPAADAAYATAEPLVRAAVEAKYPARDMKICAKYEAAKVDDCIKLQLTAGGVQQFDFHKDTGPLVVKKTFQGAIYLADAPTTDAVVNWVKARDERGERTKAVRADYYALIKGAKTLDEIVEIWPEAANVAQYARSQALTVLSDDVVARIRADVRARGRGRR